MAEPEFVKYPDTKHFRDVVKQAGYDFRNDIPEVRFRGTVKVHGTHADMIFAPDGAHWLQSRNRIISPEADNSGFAKWMAERDVSPLLELVRPAVPENDAVMMAGEFCGKGIFAGTAVSKVDRFFMIFGIKVGDKWQDMADFEHVRLPDARIFNAREFGNYDMVIDLNKGASEMQRLEEMVQGVEKCCPVGKGLGVEGTGEGIVWTPYKFQVLDTRQPPDSAGYFFKVKGDEHRNVSEKKLAELKGCRVNADKQLRVREFAAAVTCEPRLRQGLAYLQEMGTEISIQNVGKFLKWVGDDVLKEESDLIKEYGLKPAAVTKAIPGRALSWFKRYLSAIDLCQEKMPADADSGDRAAQSSRP